jgi:hypothetical protein
MAQSVVIRYGLNSTGIESQCGRDIQHPSKPTMGPTQHPVKWLLSTVGAWRLPPTTSSTEVKEIVELYLYPPLGVRGRFLCILDLYLLAFVVLRILLELLAFMCS